MSNTLPQLKPRAVDSHKGDFGHALLIGGSSGMAGAISLSGMAALRSGAGLVTIATPAAAQPTVAGFEPSYMTVSLPCDQQGLASAAAYPIVAKWVEKCTALCMGPGLQRSNDVDELVRQLYREAGKPMIVDADALNALAAKPELLSDHAGPRILTPHPGEFARLVGIDKLDPADRKSKSMELAERADVVVVLKGEGTVVTDGKRCEVNHTGNPGMATGGCGDVLSGMIVALVGQQLAPYDAARLGVYLHGLAGDLAAEALGPISLIASDLIDYLPKAFQTLTALRSPHHQ